MPRCDNETPVLRGLPDGHRIACHATGEMR
jgi:hypothetical protein